MDKLFYIPVKISHKGRKRILYTFALRIVAGKATAQREVNKKNRGGNMFTAFSLAKHGLVNSLKMPSRPLGWDVFLWILNP